MGKGHSKSKKEKDNNKKSDGKDGKKRSVTTGANDKTTKPPLEKDKSERGLGTSTRELNSASSSPSVRGKELTKSTSKRENKVEIRETLKDSKDDHKEGPKSHRENHKEENHKEENHKETSKSHRETSHKEDFHKENHKEMSKSHRETSSRTLIKEEPKPKEDKDSDEDSWDQPVIYSKDQKKVTAEDFELLNVIGTGSFGKVMQVRKKDDGQIYAMKVLRKEAIIARKQIAHTMAERNILQKIQHPFIVNLHYAFQTDDKLYMVLDYINGGELFFHLKKEGKFPEVRVRLYAAEIVLALRHLHSLGIVYRDLKPENILIDAEGHIVITDFGLSKELTGSEGTYTFCGTPEYLAPEVLKGQGHGTAVDWWSLGTLIFEMLTGLPPFYSQNMNIMYQKILSGELRFPAFVSAEAQSLLEGLLQRDPEKRLGSCKDTNILEHSFFRGLDWDKLYNREVSAAFKPKVKSEADVSQIDPVFTQQQAIDSVVDHTLSPAMVPDGAFDNFTFVGTAILNTAS